MPQHFIDACLQLPTGSYNGARESSLCGAVRVMRIITSRPVKATRYRSQGGRTQTIDSRAEEPVRGQGPRSRAFGVREFKRAIREPRRRGPIWTSGMPPEIQSVIGKGLDAGF